jgi:hypothetical protein
MTGCVSERALQFPGATRSIDDPGGALSPRVPVAIRNNAVSTMAAASDAVTHTTGVFICKSPSRRRPLFFKKKLFWKKAGQTGSGIAMLTLIDITVSATIRHSESAPIASEAATALVNRDEATGAAWPSKPAARSDRVMAGKILKDRGRITRGTRLSQESQAIFGRQRPERGKTTAEMPVMPAVFSGIRRRRQYWRNR